ncbi:hypothetical protein BDY19DRAFT_994394 [Irpex rosettiformis]|uniref:Uncharacterized protein n=1 Tax=Irpex rosettiformis TaxID=378272 RepID=A0ACB8U185_9APHY|nr:hypothetical protein BDY19DRAFT_994394 [Irpex rosettiformis]
MSEFHTFLYYANRVVVPGFVIPQRVYRTDTVFQPSPPVQFFDRGHFGIRLTDALSSNSSGLADGSRPIVLTQSAMKIAIRIWWPGYDKWMKHMHVYGHTSDRLPITKAMLALHVARLVQEFRNDMINEQSADGSRDWWLSNIPFDKIVLVELRHVSPGSWQPVLCYAA